MVDLYSYIKTKTKIDGHTHLFDHEKSLECVYNYLNEFDKVVGFIDIRHDKLHEYTSEKLTNLYTDFIFNKYNPLKHILLASSYNIYDAIKIHKKFPTIIKGFGEFKCYENYMGKYIGRDNLDWLIPLCEYNKTLHLPIYIHWVIRSKYDIDKFIEFVNKYPSIPFVLCHCGMGYDRNDIPDENIYNLAFKGCLDIQDKCNNVYFDVSYRAINYFYNNLDKFEKLLPEKKFIGSDINPNIDHTMNREQKENYIYSIYKKMRLLYSDRYNYTIQNIFNI